MKIDFRQALIGAGVAAAASLSLVAATLAATDSGYAVIETWPVAGEGKWDYLTIDAARRHLFLSRATHVQVLDLDTGKLAGDIANTPGVHGIALATDLHRGFTSNGKADSITVFDLDTLATVAEVKISGRDPDAIVYDAPSKRIYAFNGHSNDATVIDAAAAREIGSVPLPGKPEFAVSDGQGHVFVNIEDKALVVQIDVAHGAVSASWPLAPCVEPTGIALDVTRHRLFSVCHNQKLIVTDAASGKRVAELLIGKHADAVAFDAATGLVFSSNGDSANVTVIKAETADRYSVQGSLASAPGAKTMAFDPATHRLYVPALTASGLQVLIAAPK